MRLFIPPVLFLSLFLLMIGLDRYYPMQEIIAKPYHYIGILPLLIGFLMTTQTARLIKKRDTQISPFGKPRKLIIDGWFKISRNPIYLGFTLSLLGIWLLLGSLTPIIGYLLFPLITNFSYIPMEEKNMEEVFGADYLQYKTRVRRWI